MAFRFSIFIRLKASVEIGKVTNARLMSRSSTRCLVKWPSESSLINIITAHLAPRFPNKVCEFQTCGCTTTAKPPSKPPLMRCETISSAHQAALKVQSAWAPYDLITRQLPMWMSRSSHTLNFWLPPRSKRCKTWALQASTSNNQMVKNKPKSENWRWLKGQSIKGSHSLQAQLTSSNFSYQH
jgi:hypothetical protein